MGRYAFALRPKWILSHALVLALVVVMINLGFWQLDRHDERAERNERIEQRATRAPVSWGEITEDPGRNEFVRVEVDGHFDDGETVLVANRTLDGAPGFWVMTPLRIEEQVRLWVARGFVNRETAAGDPAAWSAGDGPVTVVGTLQLSADGGVFAPDRETAEISRPDTGALSQRAGFVDQTVYLQAESNSASPLTPIPLPDLDAGPHRGYAAQWFIFSAIALVGYPLVLRKVAAGTVAPDAASV